MKKVVLLFSLFSASFFWSQNVYLNSILKTHENTDTSIHTLSAEETEVGEYLGEIEVQGFSLDDAAVYSKIYRKVKEIGGNAVAYKPFPTIDDSVSLLDPAHYRLAVYYNAKENRQDNVSALYLFADSPKEQKIRINDRDYLLPSRSYIKILLEEGKTYTVSTKKLFGSTVRLKKNPAGESQYFKILSGRIGGAGNNDGTLHIKTGDIIRVNQSFGEFLRLIYKPLSKE